MGTRSSILAASFACLLVGCATARPAPRPSQLAMADCGNLRAEQAASELYAADKVQRVEPRYRTQFLARAIEPRYVAGANVYIPAQPGLTRAYLQRVLTCHVASGTSSHPNDPLKARGVRAVSVSEAGAAIRIAVIGEDRAAGREIWQRALALNSQEGTVSVEQL